VDWTVMHVAGLWGYLGALLVYHTHASKADNERCVFWLSASAHDTYALRDALEIGTLMGRPQYRSNCSIYRSAV
jgi:hypothetical protein